MTFTPERRKSKDPLMKCIAWANTIAAIGLFTAICITAAAKPQTATFFDHYFDVNVQVHRRPQWNMVLVDYIALMLVFSGLTSIAGLIINSRRLKRKGDFIRATMVLCLLLSIAGLGLYIFYT